MRGATLVETHLSHLLLLDDRVLKWKKALAFEFIDLRTLDARRRICEREVELNRRLAPDVYEGVASFLGPDGELWEPVVVMRRLPDDRRLATLVRTGDPAVGEALAALAALLARFHSTAVRSDAVGEQGRPARVAARWRANLHQLRSSGAALPPAATADLAAVEALVGRWLAANEAVLDARVDGGHVVDGHGDLQADDVFALSDGPAVIDCLEFDDDLRAVDVADDIAFLVMDLEHLGRPDLGELFVDRYDAASDAPLPRRLVDHWAAYRAVVRAMVTCLRATQADADERPALVDDAALLLSIARRRLEAATVHLVLVGGAPGTGKSTLARGLAAAEGWVVVRSDEVRRRLPVDPADRYDPAAVHATYERMRAEADAHLAAGESVVLDATWGSADERAAAREVGRRHGAELTELRCVLDPEVAAARVAERARRGGDLSEATPDVARRLAAAFDPWPAAITIATDGSPDDAIAAATAAARLTDPAAGA